MSANLDQVFKALSDPTRRAIFERLARGESPVKELKAHFEISQPAVSQHLAALHEAGLVARRQEGRLTHYRIAKDGLAPLVNWLEHYQAFWSDHLPRLKALAESLSDD
ncbi:MAG: winged helix-turn-helix transcriptional regulator [Polyangiaceae bacterium]|nr:winged helix-turn-helix transcriptional regulator [Myxococcales bacterium]MCB9586388.1 winged helix-turn-helix transcriptional regulator [Polyangiaceae bacterium]MCB9607062.1 winged helix-turn-helix transcriptional regulator [Polyangiaceae bacterium]